MCVCATLERANLLVWLCTSFCLQSANKRESTFLMCASWKTFMENKVKSWDYQHVWILRTNKLINVQVYDNSLVIIQLTRDTNPVWTTKCPADKHRDRCRNYKLIRRLPRCCMTILLDFKVQTTWVFRLLLTHSLHWPGSTLLSFRCSGTRFNSKANRFCLITILKYFCEPCKKNTRLCGKHDRTTWRYTILLSAHSMFSLAWNNNYLFLHTVAR